MRGTSPFMLVALLAFAFSQVLIAQTDFSLNTPNHPQSASNLYPGVITSTVTKGDSVLERRTFDPNEEMQVIVQFQTPPLSPALHPKDRSAARSATLGTVQSQIENDHTRFQADLLRFEGGFSGAPTTRILKTSQSRVTAEYRKVFNGIALRSRRWLVEQLRALPYVKSISADKQVQALDSTSNHQIGADSVWTKYGATGAGVKIGVLDTGIDYLHQDLGGGFGPGYKVAGGWDFVNNDADPTDDAGHGTHVAGIIAANGPALRGVAPGATLYAYKVLDSYGLGMTSDIIAALERAVDPDNDPGTVDHLDIINLSLGGVGDPTDPLSQAIDNTTASGVLCVAAAGNTGYSYETLGSPGCASSAITVGACDNSDLLASFSSWGPTHNLFTIKPDLVAPGVNITSTVPGGAYRAMSGTSMAAPQVAGAAALLRQLHADWTPEMLKSALMSTSQDLGKDLWSQGMGRLNVLKAVSARALASPQTLSFGLDHFDSPRWTQIDTVTVYNVSDSALSFNVLPSVGLPAGVSLTSDASSLTVLAHQTAQLRVSLEVDNSIVQVPQQQAQGIKGTYSLALSGDTLRIPWAVIVGSYMDLRVSISDGSFPIMTVLNRLSDKSSVGGDYFASSGTDWQLRKLLSPGSYEVMLMTGSLDHAGVRWLVRDSVSVSPVATLTMSDSEALYHVGTAVKDENGAALDTTYRLTWCNQLYSKRTGVGIRMTGFGFPAQLVELDRFCPLSSNYVFDYYCLTDFEHSNVYTYAGQASPILYDRVVDIKAGDLVRRDIEYRLHPSVPSLKPMQGLTFSEESISYNGDTESPPLSAPYRQVWYAQKLPAGKFPWVGRFLNHQIWFDGSTDSAFYADAHPALLITPNQLTGADGVLRSSLLMTNTPVQESHGTKVIYGLGPSHFFGRMENSISTILRLETNTATGMFVPSYFPEEASIPFFLNQAMDVEPCRLNFSWEDSTGRVIDEGVAKRVITVPKAGRYAVRVWNPMSHVLSLKGAAMVSLAFDTRLVDRNPPAMTSFNIFGADSEYTDMLLPGELGRVDFRISDAETGLHSVHLSYHTDSARAWVSLPLTNQGDLYRGQLPAFALRDGLISLRVLATDASGNSMDYQTEPAVHIGPDYTYVNRVPGKARLLKPDSAGTLQQCSPSKPVIFSWQRSIDFDGWDTLSYTLRIRGSGLDVSFDRWTRDTIVSLNFMASLSSNELYRWWVETSDGHVTVSSDTATFRTSKTVLSASGEEPDLPKEFALYQNYPNPFNPSTTIRYALPQRARVNLTVYNTLGQQVVTLVNGEIEAGYHEVEFDASGLASGVYFYRLQAGDFVQTKKLCAIK